VLAKAEELADAVGVNARGGVWGVIKHDVYRDTLATIALRVRPFSLQEDEPAKARL